MKIDTYRLFLVCFIAASMTLLTGFQEPDFDNVTLSGKQPVSGEKNKDRRSKQGLKRKNIKNKSVLRVDDPVDVPKPLNLSIPFKASDSNVLKAEQPRDAVESSTIFAKENKKRQGPLDLNGQMLMSQEPEMDKRKSVDGAGIVINLKR